MMQLVRDCPHLTSNTHTLSLTHTYTISGADSGFPQHDLVGQGRPTIIGPVNPVQDVGRIEVDVPIAPEGVVIPVSHPLKLSGYFMRHIRTPSHYQDTS